MENTENNLIEEDQNIDKYLSKITRKSQVYISIEMAKLGISGSECLFLINVPDDGAITQQEMCNYFEFDSAFATRGVKSLIAKGLLNKVKNKKDRRSFEISLTEKGKKLKPTVFKVLSRWSDILVTDLTLEEKRDMIGKLKKINLRAKAELQVQKNNK